jgi:flagellar hook-basal body complex protein FliE
MSESGAIGGLRQQAVLAALARRGGDIEAARRDLQQKAGELRGAAAGGAFEVKDARPAATAAASPLPSLRDVQNEVAKGERLAEDLLTGRVAEFHDVAAQIKRADLTLKFSLEIRNRLIDAYREVMRMTV